MSEEPRWTGFGLTTTDARTGKRIPANVKITDSTGGISRFATGVPQPGIDDGYAVVGLATGVGAVDITAAGYESLHLMIDFPGPVNPNFPLQPSARPWETMPTDQVKLAKGAIATVLANLPWGPRPNQDNNCLFVAEYVNKLAWTPELRAKQVAVYPYRDWSLNPPLAKGYHSMYPDTDLLGDFDFYLDRMEELWLAGKVPVPALVPDCPPALENGVLNRQWIESVLTPLYSQPRFQAMARKVRLEWELDLSAADWQWLVQWAARVCPNAIRCIHFESGHGAPGNHADFVENGGQYADEGAMWIPVAPYVHQLWAQDTWAFMGQTDHGRTPMQQIAYDLLDFWRRFNEPGYRPTWPCGISANGPGIGVQVSNDEYGSYATINSRVPEEEVRDAIEIGKMGLGMYDPVIDYDGTPMRLKGLLVGYGDAGPV